MTEQGQHSPLYERIRIDDELMLRGLTPEDAEALFQATDSSRQYLAKYLPWVEGTTSVQDSLSFIDQIREKRLRGQEYGFGIILNGEVVGHISLMHVRGGDKVPEIGYWIAESASGQGVTTKAAEAVTQFAFEDLGLDLVLIGAAADNVGSNRIAESLGYYQDEIRVDEHGVPVNYWLKENPGHFADQR